MLPGDICICGLEQRLLSTMFFASVHAAAGGALQAGPNMCDTGRADTCGTSQMVAFRQRTASAPSQAARRAATHERIVAWSQALGFSYDCEGSCEGECHRCAAVRAAGTLRQHADMSSITLHRAPRQPSYIGPCPLLRCSLVGDLLRRCWVRF